VKSIIVVASVIMSIASIVMDTCKPKA